MNGDQCYFIGDYLPKKERKQDDLTFGELMEKHYLPWADGNKKRARDNRSLYKCWLAPRVRDISLNGIFAMALERLKKEMREGRRAEASVKRALCLVRQAINMAVNWNLWSGVKPCHHVIFPNPNNARQCFLKYDEAEMLLQKLRERSPQLSRIAAFSLFLGLRLSEIFDLRWSNVDLASGMITVLNTKNGESRKDFVTGPIQEILAEIGPGEPDELLFKTNRARQEVWLSKTFKVVADSLGLNRGITDPRDKVCFHSLRHTFASWAAMKGVPLYVLGKSFGRKTSAMTERYSHLTPESQKRVFEAVAEFQGGTSEKAELQG